MLNLESKSIMISIGQHARSRLFEEETYHALRYLPSEIQELFGNFDLVVDGFRLKFVILRRKAIDDFLPFPVRPS
mgnify:CR=1 FL=1